ncbi:DUF3541 domain-containing protein [Photobacterium sagamiensis]|uniref:DUF3541 domain-containing protein n=1 Tax=Photobacterium sagamiensis TaxID=2910241 RepID=UPI003D0F253C
MKSLTIGLPLFISLLVAPAISSTESALSSQGSALASKEQAITNQAEITSSFKQDAQLIRDSYEAKLFTLPAFKSGHYGLRMYRQTLDNKYEAAVWSDMARVASRLNKFATEVYTPEQIQAYSNKRIEGYLDETSERSKLRYEATKQMPEYLYLGVDLLGSMARANEYGLKHREDAKLHQVIRRYDFAKYATDEAMIKAWAAQLANQVYWLRQLGEQDVVDDFIAAFRKAYPDSNDSKLSEQQFGNKIYGLTHIIFAASAYYQHQINEQDFHWVYDYYRNNIDTIIARAKEDVIAEVGINFLLAGLGDDPVVLKTQKAIQQALNREHGLVPSVTGGVELRDGEHRNVLAIMLLDWKGPHVAPTITKQPDMFDSVPYGLVAK